MALPSWSLNHIVANLSRSNSAWHTATITYGFPRAASSWASGGEGNGFSAFNDAQKDAAREAISLWDDLVAVDFKETSSNPNITYQNTTTAISYAHAYFPGSWAGAGSVWTNPSYHSGTNDLVTPMVGEWGFMSFIHETGHALGLDHPGNYSGSVSYQTSAWYRQDSLMYTVMSYFDPAETGADWKASNGHEYYPQTPMIHDVAAIQVIYGAETATRNGDTVYGFNSTANREVFDFTVNTHPVLCIWDAGGTDTLDFSGFGGSTVMDLRAGASSNCDGMTDNVWIAFGTVIENAEGGAGRDEIIGNSKGNLIFGNSGSDVIRAGYGRDIIHGGAGNDTIIGGNSSDRLEGGAGADTFVFQSNTPARDVISDFTDGVDVVEFISNSAARMADLEISGQGTRVVTVTAGDQIVVLKSASIITFTHDDVIFG